MKDGLIDRFAPGVPPTGLDLLEQLLTVVDTFSEEDDGSIACVFPEDAGTWVILPPLRPPESPTKPQANRWRTLDAKIRQHAPEPYQAFLKASAGFIWGEVGDTGQLTLGNGFDGTLSCLGKDALDEEALGAPYSDAIFSPIDIDMGDFYFVHPLTKCLCYQTEGCIMEVTDGAGAVEVYLREMHLELKDVRVDSAFRRAFRDAPHRTAWLRDWEPT